MMLKGKRLLVASVHDLGFGPGHMLLLVISLFLINKVFSLLLTRLTLVYPHYE